MTIQEAINYFKNCNITMKYGTENYFKAEEVKNLAIEALEKQIPKKPILNKNRINPLWVEEALLCPTCNTYVGSSVVMICDNFCDHCGQAIEK